ncbi:hypothetical protein ILYODFUR_038998 [Ilyodon furcidens]|uniref:Uncharacterized protein n=1 Tax=Ilyodon furcidens TaxID=33524 RepID=A0ABV0UDQ1_9TELE
MATPTSKRTRSECSASTSTISPEKSYADVLDSIDNKLTSLDARLALVEVLHREFQALRESLEVYQEQFASLTAEDQTLRDSVKTLIDGMAQLSGENKKNQRDNAGYTGSGHAGLPCLLRHPRAGRGGRRIHGP